VAAYYFAEGTWPEDLQVLLANPVAPRDALTSARAPLYYSAENGGGVLILASERVLKRAIDP
jgi:hypothetical protein